MWNNWLKTDKNDESAPVPATFVERLLSSTNVHIPIFENDPSTAIYDQLINSSIRWKKMDLNPEFLVMDYDDYAALWSTDGVKSSCSDVLETVVIRPYLPFHDITVVPLSDTEIEELKRRRTI